jgi:hypothetical protein
MSAESVSQFAHEEIFLGTSTKQNAESVSSLTKKPSLDFRMNRSRLYR